MLNWLFNKTPLFFLTQSIWRDEAFSYLLAKKNLIQIITLTAKDFNPPLYYFFLHFWIKLFGGSEISLRSFSLLAFWGIIYTAYLFMQNILKIPNKKNFVFLSLFLFNPVLVYYAFEARMYTLFSFFSLLSFYFFLKKQNKPYIIFTTLGLYTHYFMIFVIICQLFFIIFNKKKQKLSLLKNLFIVCLLFLPWLIYLLLFNQNLSNDFWIQKPDTFLKLDFIGYFYLGYEPNVFFKNIDYLKKIIKFLGLFFVFFILLSIKIIGFKKLKEDRLFILLLSWGLITPLTIYLFSFIKPIYLPRYLIFSLIGLIFFIIYLLNALPKKLMIIFLTIILIFSSLYQKTQIKYRQKKRIDLVVKEIKQLAKKNDLLYVEDYLDYFPAVYYFNDQNRVYIYNSEIKYEEIPYYVGKILIPKYKIINKLPIYPKKAFILKSNLSYEIKAMF